MGYREDDHDDFEPTEEKAGGGGILAIILLIIGIFLIVFLFRDELGIGTPEVDISIPDDIGVEAPPPVVEDDGNVMDNAIMGDGAADAI